MKPCDKVWAELFFRILTKNRLKVSEITATMKSVAYYKSYSLLDFSYFRGEKNVTSQKARTTMVKFPSITLFQGGKHF